MTQQITTGGQGSPRKWLTCVPEDSFLFFSLLFSPLLFSSFSFQTKQNEKEEENSKVKRAGRKIDNWVFYSQSTAKAKVISGQPREQVFRKPRKECACNLYDEEEVKKSR